MLKLYNAPHSTSARRRSAAAVRRAPEPQTLVPPHDPARLQARRRGRGAGADRQHLRAHFASIWEGQYPRVTDWYARVQARPAFRATCDPGTRMSETFPLRPAIVD